MKGAFNDVALTLLPGTKPDDVLVHLDSLLDRYGGLGSYSRRDQMSHRFPYLLYDLRPAVVVTAVFIASAAARTHERDH